MCCSDITGIIFYVFFYDWISEVRSRFMRESIADLLSTSGTYLVVDEEDWKTSSIWHKPMADGWWSHRIWRTKLESSSWKVSWGSFGLLEHHFKMSNKWTMSPPWMPALCLTFDPHHHSPHNLSPAAKCVPEYECMDPTRKISEGVSVCASMCVTVYASVNVLMQVYSVCRCVCVWVWRVSALRDLINWCS